MDKMDKNIEVDKNLSIADRLKGVTSFEGLLNLVYQMNEELKEIAGQSEEKKEKLELIPRENESREKINSLDREIRILERKISEILSENTSELVNKKFFSLVGLSRWFNKFVIKHQLKNIAKVDDDVMAKFELVLSMGKIQLN